MNANSTQKALRLESGKYNDVSFGATIRLLAKYPPFFGYSFGLMVTKVVDQLTHGTNVMAIVDNKLVAYAGWIVVNEAEAAHWWKNGGNVPEPDWKNGKAVIITMTVTDHKAYLMSMFRAVSHVCAGKKVYRMRSFTKDSRQDMRRPPITGRVQDFSKGNRA